METKLINEQLEDKQQIVTYKYLTHKMNIHPNKAKQLLKDYVSKLTEEKIISITFVIGGILKENDEFCIVLAYDDHVDTMRRRFKQINFEHIYSIQPIKRLSDINNALYLVDNLSHNQIELPSSIKKKDKGDILVHKQSVEFAMEIDLPSTKKTQPTSIEISSNHSNETVVKKTLEKTEKKKTGLDFFGKSNKSNGIKPKETEDKIIPKKNNSDFFAKFKNSNTDSKSSVENVVNEVNNQMNVNSPKKNVQEHSFDEHGEKNNIKKIGVKLSNKDVQEQSSSEIHEVKNKKKSNKKMNNGSKTKNNQKVKRKRIQTFDSSDEELDSEEEDKKRTDHVMDVEDEIDFVQPTPPRPTPRENRKKEKQTTTSTFIDDDGFVCTTKEVKIVETKCEPTESVENIDNSECKELNVEPITKKIKSCAPDTAVQVDKKNNKQKQTKNKTASSSQGMKQSSLTSFFSKQ